MKDSLESIYRAIPGIECKRLCQAYCGPVRGSPAELVRIGAVGARLGYNEFDLTCSKLKGGARIYELRPLICRLWGTTQRLRCPHGCRPEAWLTEKEARRLIDRAYKLG